jgi:hypothetical protein
MGGKITEQIKLDTAARERNEKAWTCPPSFYIEKICQGTRPGYFKIYKITWRKPLSFQVFDSFPVVIVNKMAICMMIRRSKKNNSP